MEDFCDFLGFIFTADGLVAEVCGCTDIACVGTGGRVLNSSMAFVGEESYRTVAQFNADYFFFSCRGLANGLLSDISQQENLVRQEMLRHAKAGYLLCTSSRLGKVFYHNLCTEKDITGVIDAT